MKIVKRGENCWKKWWLVTFRLWRCSLSMPLLGPSKWILLLKFCSFPTIVWPWAKKIKSKAKDIEDIFQSSLNPGAHGPTELETKLPLMRSFQGHRVEMRSKEVWTLAGHIFDNFDTASNIGEKIVSTNAAIILDTRSLGALRAPTSSWRPFGPFDFALRAFGALRPCDPRNND